MGAQSRIHVLVYLLSQAECLPLPVTAASRSEGGGKGGADCGAVCQELQAHADASISCAPFARVLPHPRMQRLCTKKFADGYAFACPLMCARLANGDKEDMYPWTQRLAHNACQTMSGDKPYPSVFKACKQGYSNGLVAAGAALAEKITPRLTLNPHADAENGESNEGALSSQTDGREVHIRRTKDESLVETVVADTREHLPRNRDTAEFFREESDAWMGALESQQEYVDYAVVAQERVSAARRRRGPDLKRGPACPVCGG